MYPGYFWVFLGVSGCFLVISGCFWAFPGYFWVFLSVSSLFLDVSGCFLKKSRLGMQLGACTARKRKAFA